MTLIRHISINNFRSLKSFSWTPSEGVNCLIGPGDSGKTSVLDAIEYCIGSKRSLFLTDADFHANDVSAPISIQVTIGKLHESMLDIEKYGFYLRGFNSRTKLVEDEPGEGLETVLTIDLTISDDLEPIWTFFSVRALEQSNQRHISYGERLKISPTRLGTATTTDLSWKKGSILNRLSDERVDVSSALSSVARTARAAYGDQANESLRASLDIILATAQQLGVPVGSEVHALLSLHNMSFGEGALSLHDANRIPLQGMGLGSRRLLLAGLQKKAADNASTVLIDEVEHGLEPHRIIRLLGALGAKDADSNLQVFMTTHSPVVVRELSVAQIYILRRHTSSHIAHPIPAEVQGTVRTYPEALLATAIVVCEGATEVGLIRGIDKYFLPHAPSIFGAGLALVDGKGSTQWTRALAFQKMGFKVAMLRDDDVLPPPDELTFIAGGGKVCKTSTGKAMEEEIFSALPVSAVQALVAMAVENRTRELVNSHLHSTSSGIIGLPQIEQELTTGVISQAYRSILGKASRKGGGGEDSLYWFKNVTLMENAAFKVIAPTYSEWENPFRQIIDELFGWCRNVAS